MPFKLENSRERHFSIILKKINDEVLLHLASLEHFVEQNLHREQDYYNHKANGALLEFHQASYREYVPRGLSILKYLTSKDFVQLSYRKRY